LLGAREPEPFAVVVVAGAILEIGESGGVLGVCVGFAEGDGDYGELGCVLSTSSEAERMEFFSELSILWIE